MASKVCTDTKQPTCRMKCDCFPVCICGKDLYQQKQPCRPNCTCTICLCGKDTAPEVKIKCKFLCDCKICICGKDTDAKPRPVCRKHCDCIICECKKDEKITCNCDICRCHEDDCECVICICRYDCTCKTCLCEQRSLFSEVRLVNVYGITRIGERGINPALENKLSKAQKRADDYLKEHKIFEFFHFLLSHLLANCTALMRKKPPCRPECQCPICICKNNGTEPPCRAITSCRPTCDCDLCICGVDSLPPPPCKMPCNCIFCICDIGDNPVAFLMNLLHNCLQYRTTSINPPLLYENQHLESLFRTMDPLDTGLISINQYNLGMTTIGVKEFKRDPPITGKGLVPKSFFIKEARRCLVLLLNEMITPHKYYTKKQGTKMIPILSYI